MTKHSTHLITRYKDFLDSSGGAVVKTTSANAGDTKDDVSIPETDRLPGIGNDNLFQYSCLEISQAEQPQSVGMQRARHD